MKPKSKNQRLLDCTEAFQKTVDHRAFTIDEVMAWMEQHGLLDVPSIRDSQAVRDAWDAKFAEACAATKTVHTINPATDWMDE